MQRDDADALIEALAARQHGVVSRTQLLEAGLSRHVIEYRVGGQRHGIPVASPARTLIDIAGVCEPARAGARRERRRARRGSVARAAIMTIAHPGPSPETEKARRSEPFP